tara:strand:+ start:3697 stop:4332 length:636 start_codon:yes stop_codon:yes gene_type:complete
MKSSEMLNKIRTILDIQVRLEDRKLENGTVITAEAFSQGKEVFIKSDDEKVKMPIGEYELESGEVLVVKEEGLIDELKEVEMKYDDREMDEHDDRKEEADVADWKGMEKRIQNLEDAIADLKKDKESNSEKVEEVDTEEQLKEEVKEVEVNAAEEVKEDVSKEVKEELSKPAADPIKHSPETGTGERPKGFTFSQSKQKSIKDRIFEKLNN